VIYLIFGKLLKHRYTLPIMLLAPAAVGLLALIVYPIIYEVVLSFSNMSLFTFRNPKFGLSEAARNFSAVFTQPVLKLVHFLPLFLRTVLWTTIQVTFHVTLGMILALLLTTDEAARALPNPADRALGDPAGRRGACLARRVPVRVRFSQHHAARHRAPRHRMEVEPPSGTSLPSTSPTSGWEFPS